MDIGNDRSVNDVTYFQQFMLELNPTGSTVLSTQKLHKLIPFKRVVHSKTHA